ncbi:MAG: hypothetical protein IPQ07_26980 [Myxococcales bacterium]|nr:hypothetical protein [Myxococcales bacterium]
MRLALATTLLFAATTAAAADPKPLSLSAADVSGQLAPYAEQIEHCYLDRTPDVRGAGQLQLVLTVTRHGSLEALEIKTPGLAAKLAKQIDGCIRETIETVAFPARRTFTTATVPYFFQRTLAPNAGPQLSCWDPKGCHGR